MQSGTTRYTQDLIVPLSQILSDGSSTCVYGLGAERLLGEQTTTRTWYATNALGSLRATLSSTGQPPAVQRYDPCGTVQGSASARFGFTGELQDRDLGLVYLRARWYHPTSGTFLRRDPFACIL